jgi:predicted nucleic acid-binding Zn finger protein
MTHPCVDDGYAAGACEERTKLRPAWRAFDIGLAPARARRSSPPLDVVAGRPLSLSRPLGSVRFLRICIHSSPGRWYTARVVCVLSILQYGLPHIVTVLVLPTDYTESVLCLCSGSLFCSVVVLSGRHSCRHVGIEPSHNFDGRFCRFPIYYVWSASYMCVWNERKNRAHAVYRGRRGSGGQYRVERELLY